MKRFLNLAVSRDKLTATVTAKGDIPDHFKTDETAILKWLYSQQIKFGIKKSAIKKLASDIRSAVNSPLMVAEGISPLHGEDGFMVRLLETESPAGNEEINHVIDWKNVTKIDSVVSGQLLARIEDAKLGVPGKNIHGETISAKRGKPFKLKDGENVLVHGGKVFSTADGQAFFSLGRVDVRPVFFVDGDLDMKTGNINFTGDVIIEGNIPPGYEVRAEGSIKVGGSVEGSSLHAGGSITISGGISGGGSASVEAGEEIQSAFINSGDVISAGDVRVSSYILHSSIISGGSVVCRNGTIIGGTIKAKKGIVAGSLGNHHYTRTILRVGDEGRTAGETEIIRKKIGELQASIEKLAIVTEKLEEKKRKQNYFLTPQEREFLIKQEITYISLMEKSAALEQRLASFQDNQVSVSVNGVVYPNTEIHIGAYCKTTSKPKEKIRLQFSQGSIIAIPQ